VCYRALGDPAKARSNLEEAVRTCPRDGTTLLYLGGLCGAMGDGEQASRFMGQAKACGFGPVPVTDDVLIGLLRRSYMTCK
jgi:predicted Rossmann-fold nucleotide-binding protein